jgi:Sulfotransferase family
MTKAIILTTQRTGSTFLVECLESHPEVFCLGEMLAGGHVWVPDWVYKSRYATKAYRYLSSGAWNPLRMMNRYFARTDRPVMCFKAMYNHIRPPWTIRYLREHAEIRILHLRRHNLLKQYVSHALLSVARDKVWQPHATAPVTPTSITVSPDAALAYMRRIRAEHARHEVLFSGHPRYQLSYETMIDGQSLRSGVAREVCAFLGISDQPMKSKLIKMNPVDLRDMVRNHDELSAAIHGTEFEDLLDSA